MRKRVLYLIIFSLYTLLLAPLHAQTLTLDSCLDLARRNNYEMRTSRLDVEKAEAVKRQAFTKFFPQVTASGLGYYAVDPLIHFGLEDIQSSDMRSLLEDIYDLVSTGSDVRKEMDLMKKGLSASVVAVQPIYAGGRIINGNKLARLGVEASEMQAEMKRRDMLETVASSFYLVVGLQEKVATVDAALSLLDSLDRTVQLALANGLITRSDQLQVELKRNEMLANQQQLSSGIRLAKRLLCNQIGITYNDTLQFVDDSPALPNDLIQNSRLHIQNYQNRPEVKLLQMNVEAEQLRKKMTRGETLPQLAIVGAAFYGNVIKKEPSGNGIALLSLSIPLTDWWETSHKMQQHNIAIEQAHLQQDHYNEMMSLEVEKAYSDMVDAWMLLKSDSSALDIAQENYRLAALNYSAGTMTLTDVLHAHALLLQARNAITDRRITYIVARQRLDDIARY